jgi:glycine/D-amino acid oxidase-like deaminating enzyme
MGSKNSTPTSSPQHGTASEKLLQDFDLSAPRAAVVGAGLAGVHAAYELSKLGFKVTVFDKGSEIGGGSSTRHAWPVVGVGARTPVIWDIPLSRDLFWGVLPFGVPDIHSKDCAYITFFSSVIHRWMYARRFGGQAASDSNRKAVLQWGQDLSAASVIKVQNMCKEYPALARCIQPLEAVVQVPQRVEGSANAIAEVDPVVFPASPTPLLVDPVRWTQTLAKICHEQLGITFRLNTPVKSLSATFRNTREYVADIRFIEPIASERNERVAKAERYDVYVLACGGEIAQLTASNANVPVIDLRGYGLTLSPSSELFEKGVGAITADAVSAAPKVTSFFTDILPRNSICAFPSLSSPGDVVLSGLYSFDTYSKGSRSAQWIIDALSAAVRVHLRRELEPSQSSVAVAAAATPFSYSRCVSPDGLPIISNTGRMFNCFVCAAFGDHQADWGPAAAEKLSSIIADVGRVGSIVTSTVEDVAANPYSLSRFPKLYPPQVLEKRFAGIAKYEEAFVMKTQPQLYKINQFLNDIARSDGCPDFFRTFVFQYFYEHNEGTKANDLPNTAENVLQLGMPLTFAGQHPEDKGSDATNPMLFAESQPPATRR